MLKKLLIQNFQAHGKLRVDFDPRITSIVGPSDSGKSAIIRALQWVCTNTPGGDAFIKHGTEGSTVKLVVDDKVITRKRGANINAYYLDDQEFKAFGRGVPEPVLEVLNMAPICWQGQHDAAYWFSEPAGEVSRQLNSIVNLGIIDTTLANVARRLSKARTRMELAEEALEKAKADAEALKWVPEYVEGVATIKTAATKATEAAERADAVRVLVGTVELAAKVKATEGGYADSAEAATEAGSRAIDAAKSAGDLLGLLDATEALREAVACEVPDTEDMDTAVQECRKLREALGGLAPLIKETERLRDEAECFIPSTDKMDAAMGLYREKVYKVQEVNQLAKGIIEQETELCRLKQEMEAAEAALPRSCPLCGK